MKSRLILLGAGLAVAHAAFAGFTPIALNPASYNHDPVVEKTAPPSVNDAVTATMDGGTNKNGNTWFEVGYYPGHTNGIPAHDSLVSNAAGTHTWRMPPDYHANNVLMIGHNNGGQTPVMDGALTLTSPAKFTALSFLTASGGATDNRFLVNYTIHYADTTTEYGSFQSFNWFDASETFVFNAAGRVSLGGGLANIDATPACRAYQVDIPVGNPSVNVAKVEFSYAGSGNNGNTNNNGRAVVFAIAGSTDGVTFNPVPVAGFNHDAVVEADGPPTTGTGVADAGVLTNSITVSMDGGIAETGSTWYEQGYYAAFPTTGLPAAGSTIKSASYDAVYDLPPSYAGNCSIFLCQTSNVNISLATPAPYGALSFLCGAGGGNKNLPYVVSFADGTTETGTLFVPDWFNREIPWAYLAFGRMAPTTRSINNSLPEFVDPFANPEYPFQFDFRGLALPAPRLYDAVINLTNTVSAVTNISLTLPSTGAGQNVSIFAVSGAAPENVPPIFGARGSAVPGMPYNAPVNGVALLKAWEGSTNIVLAVTNIAGASVSYQWKKAPRGGGLRDMMYSFDYSTFANVVDGGRISGANSSVLVIANALTSDSADYLCVASNPYGAATSTVATVMILTTNQSIFVGAPGGDLIASYTSDASTAGESIDHVIDRVAQKWLSCGLNSPSTATQILPFVGPIGYVVTPVSGGTVVTAMRFYTANDAQGRDPMDYGLEGSNDNGASWTPITGGRLIGTLSLPTTRNTTGAAVLTPLADVAGASVTNCVEVNFANTVGYKSYRVTITNTVDRLRAPLFQIAEIDLLGTLVANPPVWVRQPEPASTVYAGASPTFTAIASGYPPATYQWYAGATLIPGATGTSYTFPNAQLAHSGSAISCQASNRFGKITSSSAFLTVVAAPTEAYPTAVLADAPVGYWRLNETPDNGAGNLGVLAHDYRGGHNGYYTNAELAYQGFNPLADPDTAARFGQYVVTPNSYVADIKDVDFSIPAGTGGRAFSIEAWAAGGSQETDAAIVTKGYNGILTAGTGTGTEQFVLDVVGGPPRTFRFLVRDAAGNATVAQSSVPPYDPNTFMPVWHHLVGVCDQPNGKVYLYVDGLLAASANIGVNVGILAQPMPMTIGARKQNDLSQFNQQWSGLIDDVALYNAALSPSQVLNHYYGAQLPPAITLQPTNTTTPEGVAVTFYSAAYGSGNLGYQWYISDGVNPVTRLAGQTSPNLTFITTAAQNGFYYQLVVTNQYGTAISSAAQLNVASGPPTFLVDVPAESTFGLGHVIRLEVQPGGTAPFTYQWKKGGVNLTDNYRISGSQSNVLIIGYATNADAGNYQVVLHNALGDTPSTACAVTISVGSSAPPFTAAGTGWTMQGTPSAPVMSANRLEISSGLGSTARSAWVNDKINVGSFAASFVYTLTSGAGGADGVTFCLQNQAVNAVGGVGGGLGYSGLTPSVALALNIYDPNTRGIRWLTGGTVTTPFFPVAPVLIGGNANPVQVNLNYSGGVLAATFKDTVTSATYTTNLVVDIPGALGSSTAWVGFTGADGGVTSTQIITDFSLAGQPFPMKSRRVGNNLVLSWPASAGAFLKQTPTLTNPVWSDCTALFRVVGDEAQVTITPLAGDQFYRLLIMP